MYGFFDGIIEYKSVDGVVIDVNGIGYNILMPEGAVLSLPKVGERMKVYTYTSLRQDALCLYGFATREELDIFKMLITVSGIGPKAGQAILSTLTVDRLKQAIVTEDAKLIASAPGVGKKSADRVIVDLRDKIKDYESTEVIEITIPDFSDEGDVKDAIDALLSLGTPAREAKEAVKLAVESGITGSENLLKGALKYL